MGDDDHMLAQHRRSLSYLSVLLAGAVLSACQDFRTSHRDAETSNDGTGSDATGSAGAGGNGETTSVPDGATAGSDGRAAMDAGGAGGATDAGSDAGKDGSAERDAPRGGDAPIGDVSDADESSTDDGGTFDGSSSHCAVEIATGTNHTCARRGDGTLWCWGSNAGGQLGLGPGGSWMVPAPTQVTSLGTTVVEVTAGTNHTCARKQDGTVWCWGYNDVGQVGDGTTMRRPDPVQVTDLGMTTVEIDAGFDHTCARKQNGELWCWGMNADGRLGDGSITTPRVRPVQTMVGMRVTQVGPGGFHSCAVALDASLWCWGYNSTGELGNGAYSTTPTSTPIQVTTLGTTVAKVVAGRQSTCARTLDSKVYCWGDNGWGQVGDGTTMQDPNIPKEVIALGSTVVDLWAGRDHTCALKQAGTLWCWGANEAGQVGDGMEKPAASTPIEMTALGDTVAEAAGGGSHTCARKSDGSVWCWGNNGEGELGDETITPTTMPRLSPVQVHLPCP
jgi:hypothetical protein